MLPNSATVSIGIAFLAGLLSFISPCVLPLVPAYISYLGARAGQQTRSLVATVGGGGTMAVPGAASRTQIFVHGLMFVLGFTLVFVVFGLAVTASLKLFGVSAYDIQIWIARIGGVLVIFFGLHVLGLTGWIITNLVKRTDPESASGKFLQRLQAVLYADTRRQIKRDNSTGYVGSVLMGVAFGAGWTPCIGPIYGSILTVASNGSTTTAAILLTTYSFGLGLPFLLAAIGIDRLKPLFRAIQKRMRVVELVSGVLLILMGVLLLTGRLSEISGQLGGGLADTQARIEDCTIAVAQGRIPAGDLGTCVDLGFNTYRRQSQP